MKLRLSLTILLLAATGGAIARQAAPAPAAAPASTEEQRLNAFLDRAFDEQAQLDPQLLTSLGSRDHYGELNAYTEAHRRQVLELQERQLAELRREFAPARLSPAGRLSFRLFEKEVEDDRAAWRWRWHAFPATNNGSPMGSIPVFLINNHRIESVADAEAYISRLREVERVMGEIGANMRRQADNGIVPPAFNFAPVREDGRRVLAGAPFRRGSGQRRLRRLQGQGRAAVDRSGGEGTADRRRPRGADRPVPPRLRFDACDARRDRAARERQSRRLEPARWRGLLCPSPAPIDHHGDERRADPPDRPHPGPPHPWRDGADQGPGRLHRHAPAILRPPERRAGVQISEHRRGPAGLSRRRPRLHRPGDGSGAALVPSAAAGAAGGPRGRGLPPGDRRRRLLQPALARRLAARHLLRQPRRHEPGAPPTGRGDRLSRGRARPPFPDRAGAGARRRAQVPPLRRLRRLCAKAGASMPRGSARRWASTASRSASSACSRPSSGARSAWSSTPASTTIAGPASGRSTISWPTACSPAATRPRRSSAISTIRARRPAT